MYILNKDGPILVLQMACFSNRPTTTGEQSRVQYTKHMIRGQMYIQCSCVQNAGKYLLFCSPTTSDWVRDTNKVSCSGVSQIARLLSSGGWLHPFLKPFIEVSSSKELYNGLQLTLDISSVHLSVGEGHWTCACMQELLQLQVMEFGKGVIKS